MVRIPTLIPQHWRDVVVRFWHRSLADRLWQLFLVLVGGVIVVAALSSGIVFVATVAGIVVSIVLADDIRATVRNVWNRNFWVFKHE